MLAFSSLKAKVVQFDVYLSSFDSICSNYILSTLKEFLHIPATQAKSQPCSGSISDVKY